MASNTAKLRALPVHPTAKSTTGPLTVSAAPPPNPQIFAELSHKIQAQLKHQDRQGTGGASVRDKRKKGGSRKAENGNGRTAPPRGEKRDYQGSVKKQPVTKDAERTNPNTLPIGSSLESEVYGLGGTEDDLKVIDGVESESEMEVEAQNDTSTAGGFDKGLKKGIADIMKQFDGVRSGSNEDIDAEPLQNDELPEQKDWKNKASTRGDEHPEQRDWKKKQASVRGGEDIVPLRSVAGRSGHRKLLIQPRSDWFNVLTSTAADPPSRLSHLPHGLHEHAITLLEAENDNFKTSQHSSSSQSFYTTVIVSGTLSDKVSALTLAIQESPLHNMKALDTLITLGKKRSRAQAIEVLRALKDLFAQGSLLPADRRLHTFASNPALHTATQPRKSGRDRSTLASDIQPLVLIISAYESWLKEKYFEVLKTLEVWCNDEIEFSRAKALGFVFELLKEKPEQEANLLRLLTNKLGDPSKKVASRASYLLLQLMATHPLMKLTIIDSIQSDLLFRPGQSVHAKYYAAITLNQIILSTDEKVEAVKLLDLYFSLFVGLLKSTKTAADEHPPASENHSSGRARKKSQKETGPGSENEKMNDLQEKLISAILTGINRAYPYTDTESQSLGTHLDTLFKITHSSNFNTSVQAMILIQKICPVHEASADRFYRVLYESLLDPRLAASSKHSLYLNLLYKALAGDTNVRRVKAFTKRLLQVLILHQPSFICGCFFLLQELRRKFPTLGALVDQPEDHDMDSGLNGKTPLPPTDTNGTQEYDGRKREPEHSNAENSCLWELVPFLVHFHPSVSASAENLLHNSRLSGKPDLELHTLIHFLDRFVYRNAKVGGSSLRGSSIMQPLASGGSSGLLVASGSHVQPPINSEFFKGRKLEDVPVEDAFFYQYFSISGKTVSDKKTKPKAGDEHGNESDESEIWKSMMDSAPDLEGMDDSDEGLEMSDLESATESSGEEFSEDPAPDNGDATLVGNQGFISAPSKKKLKGLPTFAAVEDYAKLIDEEEDEESGSD